MVYFHLFEANEFCNIIYFFKITFYGTIVSRSRLISEVNIVFHSAATVRFNEQLSIAVDINLKGTKSVLELALEIKNLIVSSITQFNLILI